MGCSGGCKCKLEVICLVLSAISTFLQILLIYLDRIEAIHNLIWFNVITAFLSATIASINSVQISLKAQMAKGEKKEEISA